ncbi:MAG: response regulator [Candidatus Aminicenantes bacterium]|jgi:DNA-binding NtrC family response regulator
MLKVLIIDDDKLIRWSLKEILTQDGHHVDTVSNVNDAFRQTENFRYELIFADFEIEDETCIDMLKKIQKSHPETQIIILSAQSQRQIEPQIEGVSVRAIIEKPFDSGQIRALSQGIQDKNIKG